MSAPVLLRLRGVSVVRGPLTLFSALDLELRRGDRVGVIGENGAGKSTLLSLLAGSLTPDIGHVDVGDDVVRVLCRQSVDAIDDETAAFADDDDRDARRWRSRLKLFDDLSRWSTMSPGERRRWQLGSALARQPDVLLLDEPTDHLDATARRVLGEALHGFGGALVIVSHDRALLEATTTSTLRVHRGAVRLFRNDVTSTLQQIDDDDDRARAERDDARARAQRAQKQLSQARQEAQAADHQRNTKTRMRNKNDSEARGMLAQNMADWASARLSRNVGIARHEHERAVDVVDSFAPLDKRVGRDVHVAFTPLSRSRLAVVDVDTVRIAGDALSGAATLVIERDSRVWIAGDNGAGKSTLLAHLLTTMRDVGHYLDGDGIVVVPQHLTREEEAKALADVVALPRDDKGRTLQLLAALGVDPERVLSSSHPSAGEARKLLLARAISTGAPALILDEPTNHLDLPSVQRLEEALRDYPGALVVVSHDEAFAKAIRLEQTWRLVHDKRGRHIVVDDAVAAT